MATLRFEVDAHGIALITLDDPARTMNVTSPELVADLMAALDRVAADPAIKGAVLTSGKPGSFVAGGDIKDFVGAHDRGMTQAEAFEISHRWNVDLRRIERCPKPIAAAINGVALGGGYELALCCKHRVLVDDEKALVGLVEVTIGLLPAGGGTQRLPRLIGVEPALALMLEGRRLKPAEALACGAVDQVVPRERLVDAAREWVREHPRAMQPWDMAGFVAPGAAGVDWEGARAALVARTRGRYPAPLALLDAVHDGVARSIDEGLHIESLASATLLPGAVARNLMRTGFVHRQLARRFAGEPGAYVQRLRRTCENEVAALLAEGVAPQRLEQVAQAADWPAMPWPEAWPCSHPSATQPEIEMMVRRLLLAVALEGIRCFDDGAVESPAEADVGSVVGIGFPRWTGGVLSYVETVGLAAFVAESLRLADRHGERFAPPHSLSERARSGRKFHATLEKETSR
jgi:3-hydroxyacyl-CoA dehydrogenase/enoyl-CoA hydratase/3-hydroxybutyryl-CoA epimerase